MEGGIRIEVCCAECCSLSACSHSRTQGTADCLCQSALKNTLSCLSLSLLQGSLDTFFKTIGVKQSTGAAATKEQDSHNIAKAAPASPAAPAQVSVGTADADLHRDWSSKRLFVPSVSP